MFLSLV